MESNKTYHYILKYGFLGISILLIILSIVSWVAPASMILNGKPAIREVSTTLILGLFAIFSLIVFLIIRDKFVIVKLGNQTINIKYKGQERAVSWLEVEQVKLIQFVYPPLYKLKTKDSENTIWFNTEPNFISANGFMKDLSDMGDLIKKKKRELGI
ncbi:hypothetical protein [Algoriphagus zhangzhouensis]|uniref:Uncharacterized protein n=1 Tax=Algoriphagus zhangzhouensis TaxID=1073327 RepID=A0A1M7ZAA4_9BACT|nr:hypothetical protein [Algoriphagus zhangzhouensis]TDY47199.1 hypothetical protein A8938_1652 [Algoriphagus zhangzhouensis]SHO61841.1 hypothetical protein SAMN04488108_1610 [Algoriphagus zhangzhouensis]